MRGILEHGFRIAMGVKTMAERFEFAAHFEVVINFAIEDDYRVAVFGLNRLISPGEIDDFEPSGAKIAGWCVDPWLIRTAMNQRIRRGSNSLRLGDQLLIVNPSMPHKWVEASFRKSHLSD